MNVSAKVFEPTSVDLLSEAVHQNRALSAAGFLERTFTFAFRSMVYPQIWEDPRADMEALEFTPQSRVMTIASGGCNVMSYLTGNPARIIAIDLNETHIALLKLKLAAAQHLPNHATFYRFFGSADDRRNVHLYRDLIAQHLDAETRAYWDGRDISGRRRISRFARNFYRYGLLGRFITSGHVMARMLDLASDCHAELVDGFLVLTSGRPWSLGTPRGFAALVTLAVDLGGRVRSQTSRYVDDRADAPGEVAAPGRRLRRRVSLGAVLAAAVPAACVVAGGLQIAAGLGLVP